LTFTVYFKLLACFLMYLGYVKAMKVKPKSNDAEHVVCAMRVRVYPSKAQESKIANALHAAHVFRNEAVSFAAERRRQRGAWVRVHPHLRRDWTPEEFAGSDFTLFEQALIARFERNQIPVQVRRFAYPAINPERNGAMAGG
jgi:adenine-specific DNA glycosylase